MITLLQHQIKIAWWKPLRSTMFKKKLLVQDIAEKAGIVPGSVRKIMNGNIGTRLSTLFALLDALEMDLWLVDKDGQAWRLKP